MSRTVYFVFPNVHGLFKGATGRVSRFPSGFLFLPIVSAHHDVSFVAMPGPKLHPESLARARMSARD